MNWLTRLFLIAAGLLGATLIFACTEGVTDPGSPQFAVARPVVTDEPTGCSPQPYAFTKAWIGPSGGSLRAGNHTLVVPAGALNAGTLITMQVPADYINRVKFGPEGLTFNNGYYPHLFMSYSNCSVKPGAKQQIAYVNDSLRVLESTSSETDPQTLTVDGTLRHFSDYVLMSTYAVAY